MKSYKQKTRDINKRYYDMLSYFVEILKKIDKNLDFKLETGQKMSTNMMNKSRSSFFYDLYFTKGLNYIEIPSNSTLFEESDFKDLQDFFYGYMDDIQFKNICDTVIYESDTKLQQTYSDFHGDFMKTVSILFLKTHQLYGIFDYVDHVFESFLEFSDGISKTIEGIDKFIYKTCSEKRNSNNIAAETCFTKEKDTQKKEIVEEIIDDIKMTWLYIFNVGNKLNEIIFETDELYKSIFLNITQLTKNIEEFHKNIFDNDQKDLYFSTGNKLNVLLVNLKSQNSKVEEKLFDIYWFFDMGFYLTMFKIWYLNVGTINFLSFVYDNELKVNKQYIKENSFCVITSSIIDYDGLLLMSTMFSYLQNNTEDKKNYPE